MKTSILAVSMIAALAAAPSVNADQAEPSASARHIVCEFGPRALVLTCWNSGKEMVYSAVPFSQVFDDGYRMIEGYSSGSVHYWVLERAPGN